MASPEARQILIKDFGYQPVDIESKSGYSRAIKETVNKLKLENPKDPRIKTLQDAVRPSRKRTTKKESTQPKKTKDDAVKFIKEQKSIDIIYKQKNSIIVSQNIKKNDIKFDLVKDKTNSVKSIQRESPLIQFFYA